jgi:SAM-dependent methyltransferase
MFFPERLKSIQPGDKVLEIGPGGSPHPRADVFLEMEFEDEHKAAIQRSSSPPLQTAKPVIYYDGTTFPFSDKEFDYVICSHVLEHVPDVEFFLSELQRISLRGYIEFPTIYYDYLYNMPTHINFLINNDGCIYYMTKSETNLDTFKSVTDFFYMTLCRRYTSMIKDFKLLFFQGFEWFEHIDCKKALSVADVCYDLDKIKIPPKDKSRKGLLKKIRLFFVDKKS